MQLKPRSNNNNISSPVQRRQSRKGITTMSWLTILSIAIVIGYYFIQQKRQGLIRIFAKANAKPSSTSALDPIVKGSANSIKVVWVPPPNTGTNKRDAIAIVRSVLEQYPQQGQNKVDTNGWKWATDEFTTTGAARLEYKSNIGFFAKVLNGGQPFIDDLSVLVQDNGTVILRSSSRCGLNDLGVNKKRLDYLSKQVQIKGWITSPAAYGGGEKIDTIDEKAKL